MLIIEDHPTDIELMLHELRRSGFDPQWECVVSEDEFLSALPRGFDVILADYALPQFDGVRALHLLNESGREIPFILVSGTIGEERAVAVIKAGAADNLLKDRLARLGPAVSQAVEQTRLRHAHKQAQEDRRAKEEAEHANAAKNEFLSRMSHELRTPLNAILGFGQLLELDALTPAQASSVTYIVNAGRHLLHLVNEVLDLSKVESGHPEIHLEEIDLHLLVEEALALIRPLATPRHVELCLRADAIAKPSVASRLCVRADRRRLTQVLLNLFSNAVKYNTEGGSVTVDYQIISERCRLRVADTGPGISLDKQARLFIPFERLGAEGSLVQGTGLGLALSKKLMQAMNGELGLECHPCAEHLANGSSAGAVFWIELPRVTCSSHAPDQQDAASAMTSREEWVSLQALLLN